MLTATLVSPHGRRRAFAVPVCPIYVIYAEKLYARQPGGNWDISSTYQQTAVLTLDDSMIIPEEPTP